MALDACTTYTRAVQLLRELAEKGFVLSQCDKGEWVIEDKFDPVSVERKKARVSFKSPEPDVPTGTDRVYYQNAYPVTSVIYSIYILRVPVPSNLAPLRDYDFN